MAEEELIEGANEGKNGRTADFLTVCVVEVLVVHLGKMLRS